MHPIRFSFFLTCSVLASSGSVDAQSPESGATAKTPAPAWRFLPGQEYPGAQGSIELKEENRTYIGTLNFDFSQGGLYVAARNTIDVPEGFSELQIKVRSREKLRLALRIQDGMYQWHQISCPYTDVKQWQTLSWNLVNFSSKESWGGPADKKLYYPIREIHLVVPKNRNLPDEIQKGSVEFGEVVVVP